MRVRGLKSRALLCRQTRVRVAPHAGAWIEIVFRLAIYRRVNGLRRCRPINFCSVFYHSTLFTQNLGLTQIQRPSLASTWLKALRSIRLLAPQVHPDSFNYGLFHGFNLLLYIGEVLSPTYIPPSGSLPPLHPNTQG